MAVDQGRRGGLARGFVTDIVVEDTVIVELKSVRGTVLAHQIQLVNYLVATGKPVGLVLNIGERKVEVKRNVRELKPSWPGCAFHPRISRSSCYPVQETQNVSLLAAQLPKIRDSVDGTDELRYAYDTEVRLTQCADYGLSAPRSLLRKRGIGYESPQKNNDLSPQPVSNGKTFGTLLSGVASMYERRIAGSAQPLVEAGRRAQPKRELVDGITG